MTPPTFLGLTKQTKQAVEKEGEKADAGCSLMKTVRCWLVACRIVQTECISMQEAATCLLVLFPRHNGWMVRPGGFLDITLDIILDAFAVDSEMSKRQGPRGLRL